MTLTEREQQAVRDHECPKCEAQPGARCIRAAMRVVNLTHPHTERVALVPEN